MNGNKILIGIFELSLLSTGMVKRFNYWAYLSNSGYPFNCNGILINRATEKANWDYIK